MTYFCEGLGMMAQSSPPSTYTYRHVIAMWSLLTCSMVDAGCGCLCGVAVIDV